MSESPPAIPQHLLDALFGTFLVGTWLGTVVFAFELTQIYRYFSLYPVSWSWKTRASTGDRRREGIWIPIMVLWMLASDLVCIIAPYIMAYTVRAVLAVVSLRAAYEKIVACIRLGEPECRAGKWLVRYSHLVLPPVAHRCLV